MGGDVRVPTIPAGIGGAEWVLPTPPGGCPADAAGLTIARPDHPRRSIGVSSVSLGDVDPNPVAVPLADDGPELSIDRQLVSAVAQRHERAAKRAPVHRAGDLACVNCSPPTGRAGAGSAPGSRGAASPALPAGDHQAGLIQ